jgi:AraC family chitin signaling transcriptional activator
MKSVIVLLIFLPFFAVSQNTDSKDLEQGNFFISHYKRDFLRSSFGNYVVMQDKEGVIYVGNVRNGLIEFDGQRVRRVLQNGRPMSAFVRDAETDSKNTIYLGFAGVNFGYLQKNKFGQNEYISLSDQLPKKDEVTSTFWGLVIHHDTVFFQTENAVYLFKNKKYLRTYKFKDDIHIISGSPDGVYLRVWGRGLFKYAEKNGFSVIKGSEKLFAQNRIEANYQLDNGDHLLVSRNIGLIRLTKKGEFLQVNNPYANKYVMEGKSYINDKVMRNGKIAIITNDKGILFLNQDLSTNAEVGLSSGLPQTGLGFVMQDRVGDIWGANSGATKISFDPSLTNFSSLNGIVGGVSDIIRHKGKLIIRTGRDLFQFIPKKSITETSVFKSLDVKELGGSLNLFDDQIVSTDNYSINAVLNGKKIKISNTYRSENSIQSKLNPSLLFSSNTAYGLLLHQFNGKVWKQIKIIGGEKYSGKNLKETEPGKIIFTTRKGIIEFIYDANGQGTFINLKQDKSFSKTKQLNGLFNLNDELLVSVDSTFKVFIVDTKLKNLNIQASV